MRRLTTEEFIKRAKEVHGDAYDYSKTEYYDSVTKVTIMCRKHGAFEQLPHNHLKGAGCNICTKIESRRMDVNDFIHRAESVHNGKYDYSKVIYKNNRMMVTIICPVHGEFEQTPYKHLSGHGCPRCAKNYKDTTESFIEKARKVHGDFYDYSKVQYVDQHTGVCIIDPEYGEFWQQPNSHLNGRGNPYRRAEKGWSTKLKVGSIPLPTLTVYRLLCKKFGEDDVFPEHQTDVYPFACDFYIKSLDLYIELNFFVSHGGHWFNPLSDVDIAKLKVLSEKAKKSSWYVNLIDTWTKRDVVKRDTAIRNGLNYLAFWKNDLSDFMEWYNSFDELHIINNI